MLPYDIQRCAGKLPTSNVDCPRRNECARYLSRPGPRSPMAWSACYDEGDAFIHVETVALAAAPLRAVANDDARGVAHGAQTVRQEPAAAHPAGTSSIGVLTANTLRTGGGLA